MTKKTTGAVAVKATKVEKKVEKKAEKAEKAVKESKSVLVKPTALYTKDEVRSILGLSKGSSLSPSKYPGMGGRGAKVSGMAVIAYLETAKKVKIGRKYASGTVSVVAR